MANSLHALSMREATMHSDVKARLKDVVNDAGGMYIDHSGNGDSGDCIYCDQDGDMQKASYEIASQGGKAVAHIDFDNSTDVVPVTSYQEEADDDDHYAGMNESFVRAKLYTELPLYERFISKAERDNADDSDFAGKGSSFPILKPGDVMAAVHAMGRAGSSNFGMAALKANIIKIAKRKGWSSSLPKAWQNGDGDSREARVPRGTKQASGLRLVEAASTLEKIVLKEAKADYEIKLIAPGKGSSAFYPKEVLQRDGPKIFTPGTHVYLNHPTAAEEAERPEGDVKNLAGVLTTPAVYHETHAKGPGLYARMKVFADHGQMVEEKAAHVGMSIRASGNGTGKMREGVPELKELTSAESVDVVTHAGAGGMILSEAARAANQEVEMTEQEITRIVEARVAAALAASPVKLLESRALRGDATAEAMLIMSGLALPEAAKARVITAVTGDGAVPLKEGRIAHTKFKDLVMAEAQKEAAYLSGITGQGNVFGMGPSAGAPPADPEKVRLQEKADRKAAKRLRESEIDVFAGLMGNRVAAKLAVQKGEAA